jgi:hypothetical protein
LQKGVSAGLPASFKRILYVHDGTKTKECNILYMKAKADLAFSIFKTTGSKIYHNPLSICISPIKNTVSGAFQFYFLVP